MNRKAAERARHLAAVVRFHDAIGALLQISTFEQQLLVGPPTPVPKPGHEVEWHARRGEVDRAAPAGARAFIEAGVGVMWKPPGTWSQYSINPAVEWATILTDSPKFGLDVLEAVCNQAIGSLETHAYELQERRQLPQVRAHVAAVVIAAVATAIGGLIVAYLAFRFGWVGGS